MTTTENAVQLEENAKPEAVLDAIAAKPQLAFQALMPRVTKEFDKPLGKQLKDILSLCMRGNKLSVDEYYQMCLFDDATYSADDKKKFVGLQKSRELWIKLMKPNRHLGLIDDKLAYEVMMRGFGLSVPKTRAIVGGHYPGDAMTRIDNEAALGAFLAGAAFPLFGKPIDSLQSLGSARFERYCVKTNMVALADGKCVSVADLWQEIETKFGGTYLFQECVEAHPVLQKICGGGLPTARVMTLDRGNGAEIYRAALKLVGDGNVADNFWRQGNLLSPVDCESGTMGAALTQMGIDGEFVATHPVSGAQIEGVTLPHWDAVKQVALDAASLLPGSVLLGFDIAISPDGPVIIEVNGDPHLILMQIAHKKGVLDTHMLEALDYVENKQARDRAKLKEHLRLERDAAKAEMQEAVRRKAA